MMLKKRIISTVSAVVMGVSCMAGMEFAFSSGKDGLYASAATQTQTKQELELPVDRIWGQDRFETAVAISKRSYPKGAPTVLVAYAYDYADALCGSPLAKALDAPILLTATEELPESTAAEMKRLGAKNVYILGGESVVGKSVEKSLTDSGLTVARVSGKDRYGTSAAVAETMTKLSGKAPSDAFFVSACDYPDALSVTAAAALKDSPIFYVNQAGKLDESIKDYLVSTKTKMSYAYVVGGAAALGDEIFEQVKDFYNDSGRYCGENRYDTNIQINAALQKEFKGKNVCIATGNAFPDALAGGVYAAKNGSPLLLADDKITDIQAKYLQQYGVSEAKKNTLVVFGGEVAVPQKTVESVLMIEKPALTVTDGETSATLSWARNSYIQNYQIYRDGKLIKTITDPFTTTYVDYTINKESSYTYRIVYNYTIKGVAHVSDVSADLKRKGFDYRTLITQENAARLNSEKNNTPKYVLRTENAQGAVSTFTSYDIRFLRTNDWATLEKFAKEHFTKDMTKAEKVAYTLNWINKNVWYGTVQDGGWAKLIAMCNNGTFSYVNCIFNHKIGQCNCYNGALASMMLYLGYDAHLVMGYRGRTDEKGKDRGGSNHWQHFWCEVKINGKTYVMEAGNYGEDGDWMHLCENYKDVEDKYEYTVNNVKKTGWKGYIKNGKIVM